MSIRNQRRKRITAATLKTYAQVLGIGSIAHRALKQLRELQRDTIRAEVFMVSTGFHLTTCTHTYRFA